MKLSKNKNVDSLKRYIYNNSMSVINHLTSVGYMLNYIE